MALRAWPSLHGWWQGDDAASFVQPTLDGWHQFNAVASGSSGTVTVTEGSDSAAAVGSAPVLEDIAITEGSDTVSFAAETPSIGAITITEATDLVSVSGEATVTLVAVLAIKVERGAEAASLTGLKYVVFNADHTAMLAYGNVNTDVDGIASINVSSLGYSAGDYAPILITSYNAATAAPDRVVRSVFGFVPVTVA